MQDEDIEADLLLIDQFMQNLQAHGAWSVNPGDPNDPNNDACAQGVQEACYEDPCAYGGCEGDDVSYGFWGCSTARAADTAPVGLALALLGLLGLIRRRRRRQSAAASRPNR